MRLSCIAFAMMMAIGGSTPSIAAPRTESPALSAPLEQRIFPLFGHLRAAPGWAKALADDPRLKALMAARDQRVADANTCAPQPLCRADAWTWTDADIAQASAILRSLASDKDQAKADLVRQMRAGGAFNRHAGLDDPALVVAAWQEAVRGINRTIAVYAKGAPPRYPKIDSIIFDVNRPEYAQVIMAQEAVTRSERRASDLFFDPALRYALGLLLTNERSDAASFLPLYAGDNAATWAAMKRIDWAAYAHSALLVFGHGPEDAQSRTGVMGHLRLRLAADRFRRGQAPVIILSGGNVHPNRTPFNEAVEMKAQLVHLYGIPADRILIEPHARHTTTNLRNIARLLLTAPFPPDKPALILSDPATIGYIGSPTLADRNRSELGYLPGAIAAGPDAMALIFKPDPVSFHIDPQDPLDP